MIDADAVIIGAGLYGLYSAVVLGKQGKHVCVLEMDREPLSRATYINQARIHQGYHYPRSLSTASKSAGYFERFSKDYSFCINGEFTKIYGISSRFSMTNGGQFAAFCRAASIPYEEINPRKYFRDEMCEAAFVTREYTYDAGILRDYFIRELDGLNGVELHFSSPVTGISKFDDHFELSSNGKIYRTPFVLNASYASVNQINKMAGWELVNIKYELCEIILCEANDALKGTGITVMDGPFFSIMPFGRTGLHSLTSVTFTPHASSHESLPHFDCMGRSNGECSPERLQNCNLCANKPVSSYGYMSKLASKYLREDFSFSRVDSLFSMKPILKAAEVDDSRPTLISRQSTDPTFISVLSGKINTVYDLDAYLSEDGNG